MSSFFPSRTLLMAFVASVPVLSLTAAPCSQGHLGCRSSLECWVTAGKHLRGCCNAAAFCVKLDWHWAYDLVQCACASIQKSPLVLTLVDVFSAFYIKKHSSRTYTVTLHPSDYVKRLSGPTVWKSAEGSF